MLYCLRFGRILLFALMFLPSALHAQATSRLSGVIRDPQGAVVPRARITVTNENTGLVNEAISSDTGDYVLLELPVGTYQLRAEAPGFRSFVQRGIGLSANQSASNDVFMRIGEVSEQVVVKSEASIVDTSNSEVRSTIDSVRMKEIPLAGRNILGLATLVPGVTTTGGDVFDTAAPSVSAGVSNDTRIFVNGNRSNNNNFELDGASFTGANYEGSPGRYPPPDSVEEVTVLTTGFKAEYGGGSAVFNAVTKSGTNEFHGTAWEFLRNNTMNARNFFGGADSNKYQYNQFGAAVGGPVIKNRAFFFFSYEGLRGRLGNTPSTSVVPTAAQRQGDLSETGTTLIDPTTRLPFAGNIIPRDRLDPVAQNVLSNFVPLPNAQSNEYSYSYPTHEDYNQYLFKVDYALTGNSRLSVRGLTSYAQHLSPPSLPGFIQNNPLHTSNLTVSHTQTFSPTTLNEFHATVQRYYGPSLQTQQNPISARELGFQNSPVPASTALPGTQVDSYFEIGTGGSGTTTSLGNAYVYQDALSMVRGRHTIKVGGDYSLSRYAEWGEWNTRGNFEFNGNLTGDSLADFLIGRPANYGQRSPLNNSISRYSIVAYAQDDYKATSRLTLNAGFRWDFNANPKERDGKVGFWVPETFATGERSTIFPNAPLGILYVGDPGMPNRVGFNHYGDWGTMGPRVGFAYDLFGNGKTVLRGGFGIFSVPVDLQQVNNSTERPPFDMIVSLNYPGGYGSPFAGRTDPFPSWKPNVKYDITPLLPLNGAPNCLCYRNGYSEQWNFAVEQAIRSDVKVSVTYVGNHALALWRAPGIAPAAFIPGVDAEGNPLSTPDNADSRRPYRDYTDIYLSTTDATRKSNSLQFVAQKRFSRGLTISGHYVLSNTMSWNDDGARQRLQDENNAYAEYARTNASVRHTAVVSWIYDLPKFTQNAIAGAFLNSWEFTGLLTMRSGFPYNLYTGTDNSLTGTGNDRPDLIGDSSSGQHTVNRYFDTDAFAPNLIGHFGNVGYNAMTGPGSVTFNTGLFKNFPIRESRSVQFRTEAFNLFNHPTFGNPDPTLNSPTFGQILSASPARILQLGLKFVF